MFQNITREDEETIVEDVEFNKKDNKMEKIKELFSIQNIIIYAISFMVSMVSFNGNLAPFGLAMFAAVCSNKIPAGIVYIFTLIGTLIGFSGEGRTYLCYNKFSICGNNINI